MFYYQNLFFWANFWICAKLIFKILKLSNHLKLALKYVKLPKEQSQTYLNWRVRSEGYNDRNVGDYKKIVKKSVGSIPETVCGPGRMRMEAAIDRPIESLPTSSSVIVMAT